VEQVSGTRAELLNFSHTGNTGKFVKFRPAIGIVTMVKRLNLWKIAKMVYSEQVYLRRTTIVNVQEFLQLANRKDPKNDLSQFAKFTV